MFKCDDCLNARVIVSENGYYASCCLDEQEAVDCLTGKVDSYIKRPERSNDDSKAINTKTE